MLMALPVVLIPGLIASPRLYAAQLPALWRIGPVAVADHTRHESVADCARDILADAPPRFALAGHSFGGYLSFEIMRQAPERVVALALLDTSARADTPEQSDKRREQIAMARKGPFSAIAALQFPAFVHPSRAKDTALRRYMRAMADDNDAEVFVRQQTAMIGRPDSRTSMGDIRCPTVVVVGDADAPTPPERAREIAAGIPGARLVTIKKSGHMTPIEKPLAVADILAAHFAAAA
jgi:pimeloyl-ACP methyl ester carboxylesterase